MRSSLALLVLGLLPFQLGAQEPTSASNALLPSEPGDSSPFRRLDLAPPSAVRAADGAPGAGYWQQRADYVISATLDTAGRSVRGEETITYTNNSPDTLRYVWLQVDQNLFTPTSRGTVMFGTLPGSSPSAAGPTRRRAWKHRRSAAQGGATSRRTLREESPPGSPPISPIR